MVQNLNMTKKQLEEILYYLQEIEWRFEYISNGPDEYVCPDHCHVPDFINNHREHSKDCQHKSIMEMIRKQIKLKGYVK